MDSLHNDVKRKDNPRDAANFLSFLSFFYTFDLFKQGYQRELKECDIYEVTKRCDSRDSGNEIEEAWNKLRKTNKAPSLYKLLWVCYGKKYLGLGFLQLVVKSIIILLTATCVEKIVKHFKVNNKQPHDNVMLYASILVLVKLFGGFYNNNYKLALIELGMKIRTALCSLIYRKCLKMRSGNLTEFNTGKVVTLMTKDVYYIDVAILFINEIWIALFHLCFMTFLIYSKIGVHALTGIGFILLAIVLEVLLARVLAFLRVKTSKQTDLRLHVTQELLSAMKMIKIHTWGNYFCEKISAIRKREIKNLRTVFYLIGITACIGVMSTKIAFYLLFVFYVHGSTFFPAEIIYFTKSCFKNLAMFVMAIPFGVVQTAAFCSAEKRISQFLNAEEPQENNRLSKTLKPQVYLKNVSVKMGSKYILKNITLTFEEGLTIVTGVIGGGKSSLLKAILNEFSNIEGKIEVDGKVSYASEEPWLFPGTVRQNILFGEPYDEKRYRKIIEICCLKYDLEQFANSDLTIVGDRGINFSRGQQCRINLARAIYRKSDIYLLDDCLSSLDKQVQEHVLNHCIKDFLNDKICILVSNSDSFLRSADNIVLMENGISEMISKPVASFDYRVSKYIDELEDKLFIIDKKDEICEGLFEGENNEKTELLRENSKDENSNIYHEKNETGKVKRVIYKQYFEFGGNILVRILLIMLFFIDQGTVSYNDKLVSQWVNDEQMIVHYKMMNETNTTKYKDIVEDRDGIFVLYSVMIFTSIVLILCRSFFHFFISTRISRNIHKAMIKQVVCATMDFFDRNFIGNMLNRFSKDLNTVDEYVPIVLYECFRMTSIIVCTSVLIASVKIVLLVPILVLFFCMFILRRYYLPTGRNLKRLECATRSPVVGHINASLDGLTTIRAHQKEQIIQDEFDRHQNLYTSAYHMTQTTARAFGFVVDILCAIFVAAILLQSLLNKSGTLAGDIGLVILQAITLTAYLEQIIQQWANLEYQMTSVERAIEYTEIKTENKKGKVLENWPHLGTIEYKNVSLTYSGDVNPTLKDINLKINPREKIGIIGRTGAGKSSFVSVLSRLYDIEGTILIDDIDIRTVALEDLRTKIITVPQNPLLFAGTIRSNIDPYHQYSDEEIWKALEVIGLKQSIKDLTNVVTGKCVQFSAGQKQLLCLARALVQKSKIIILDEATGSVDVETEDKVQEVLREKFLTCTVLMIAHRLKSVRNCDKIMFIDQGRVVEFDSPNKLLNNPNSRYKAVFSGNF